MTLAYPWKLMAVGANMFGGSGVPPLVPLTRWFRTRQDCIDAVVQLILGGDTEAPPADATYPGGVYKVIAEGVCWSAWGYVVTNTDDGIPDSAAGAFFKSAADTLLGPRAVCVNAALDTLIVQFNQQISSFGSRIGCNNADPNVACAFIPGYPPAEYQISEMNRMAVVALSAYQAVAYPTYVFQRLPYA